MSEPAATASPLPRPAPPWRHPASKVFVVLPAYDEEENLGSLLERIDQAMYESGSDYEVILVDDGSRDGTVRVAQEYARFMPIRIERHEANQGLGATIRGGLKVASAACRDDDVVVAMDADNTHTPGLIRSMSRLIEEGSDVVIASRYRPGSYVRGVPLHRRVLSYVASILFRIVFPIRGVRDYTCGYRAYRGRVLKDAFRTAGDAFVSQGGFQCMVDILLNLRKMGVIFRETPLILRYDLKGGASKMKVAQTIFRTLLLMLRRRVGR